MIAMLDNMGTAPTWFWIVVGIFAIILILGFIYGMRKKQHSNGWWDTAAEKEQENLPKQATPDPKNTPAMTPEEKMRRVMRATALKIQKDCLERLKRMNPDSPFLPMITLIWKRENPGKEVPIRIPFPITERNLAWLYLITGTTRTLVGVDEFDPSDDSMVNDWLRYLALLQESGEKAKPWTPPETGAHTCAMAYLTATGQDMSASAVMGNQDTEFSSAPAFEELTRHMDGSPRFSTLGFMEPEDIGMMSVDEDA